MTGSASNLNVASCINVHITNNNYRVIIILCPGGRYIGINNMGRIARTMNRQ